MLRDGENQYLIKEIFGPTIQGEGAMTGTVCHFVRFAGCNMSCGYCDTDFSGGTWMSIPHILLKLKSLIQVKWIVISGGEPGMQLSADPKLIYDLKQNGYRVCVETNGAFEITPLADQIVCSPKTDFQKLVLKWAHVLKLLYPQFDPEDYEQFKANHRYLQPLENKDWYKNTQATIKKLYELEGRWKLSLQTHKYLQVP